MNKTFSKKIVLTISLVVAISNHKINAIIPLHPIIKALIYSLVYWENPIGRAIKNNENIDVIKALIDICGASLNPSKNIDGLPPICQAAKKQDIALIRLLLEKGANIDIQSNVMTRQQTPLHIATSKNNNYLAHLLLIKYLANPTIKMSDGQTVLHIAARNGDLTIVKLLAKYFIKNNNLQSQQNATTVCGFTPLHIAAQYGQFPLLLYLVNNSNVNLVDKRKRSPLHYACELGRKDIIKYLILNGANPTIEDKHNKTPLILTVKSKNIHAVQTLIKFGVPIDAGVINKSAIPNDIKNYLNFAIGFLTPENSVFEKFIDDKLNVPNTIDKKENLKKMLILCMARNTFYLNRLHTIIMKKKSSEDRIKIGFRYENIKQLYFKMAINTPKLFRNKWLYEYFNGCKTDLLDNNYENDIEWEMHEHLKSPQLKGFKKFYKKNFLFYFNMYKLKINLTTKNIKNYDISALKKKNFIDIQVTVPVHCIQPVIDITTKR